jgi:MYXO-CTERM domain-containing protein
MANRSGGRRAVDPLMLRVSCAAPLRALVTPLPRLLLEAGVNRQSFVAFGLVLAGFLAAAPSWADLAPINACEESQVGQACDSAIKDGKTDLPGSCQKAQCTRMTPDGPMSYDCYQCQATEEKKDDSKCSSAATPAGSATLSIVPALALGLFWHRRRVQRA